MAGDMARMLSMLGSRSTWSDPLDHERAAILGLESEGLVEVAWRRAFRCTESTSSDPEDTVLWTACDAWVLVPDDAAVEDTAAVARAVDGVARCAWCGQIHRFDAAPRDLVDHASVSLRTDGIRAWMSTQLRSIDPEVHPLRWGTGWRVWLGDDEVSVVWVEESVGARTLSAAFTELQSTVYVTTGAPSVGNDGPQHPDAVVLSLADWVEHGDAALHNAAGRAKDLSRAVVAPTVDLPRTRRRIADTPTQPRLSSTVSWPEVTMWLVDGDTIRIERPDRKPRSWTAAELGLVHARARDRRHTKGWKLLVALCEAHGSCDWRASDNRSYAAFKVQVSGLAKQLRRALDIDAPPFHPTSPSDGLRAVFRAGPLPEPEVYVGEDHWRA